jgi:hypothetical protein
VSKPVNVLIVGDEDGFESVWVPRIHAAAGDLQRLRTLDDGEYLDDLNARGDDLAITVARDDIGWIVLDQVLDHISGGADGSAIYNPKNVRQAMLPLRRVAGAAGIAATGLLHPIKGRPKSFRELMAASHQFNAISRSSMLLAKDSVENGRRVLVRGKGNHSAAPRSFEFTIGVDVFELNGHGFEMPLVEGATEGDRTVEDLMEAGDAPVRSALQEQLAPLLTDEPQALASLARAVDRNSKDQSVRRALKALAEQGRAYQHKEGKKGWSRQVPGVAPSGRDTRHPVGPTPLPAVTPTPPKDESHEELDERRRAETAERIKCREADS